MISAIKTGIARALITFAIFLIPLFGIKWGVFHRDFSWTHFFKKAVFVHLSPDSAIWSDAFGITMPWQEKAMIAICTFFAAYIFFQLRLNINEDKKRTDSKITLWQRPDELFRWGSCVFLFLYVSACALCERTSLGTLNIEFEYASLIRDFGVAALVVDMLFLSRFLTKQASFNGMITRDDFAKSYLYLLAALAAVAICFVAWLPFLALPGALIMIRFSIERIKEADYMRGEIPDSEYAKCDEAD